MLWILGPQQQLIVYIQCSCITLLDCVKLFYQIKT